MFCCRSGYGGVCTKATNQYLVVDRIASCHSISTGAFIGANCAVFLGELSDLGCCDICHMISSSTIIFRISQFSPLGCQPLVSLQRNLLVWWREASSGYGSCKERRTRWRIRSKTTDSINVSLGDLIYFLYNLFKSYLHFLYFQTIRTILV